MCNQFDVAWDRRYLPSWFRPPSLTQRTEVPTKGAHGAASVSESRLVILTVAVVSGRFVILN